MFFEHKIRVLNSDQLTHFDIIFIDTFGRMSQEERLKTVQRLIATNDLHFIVKISRHDPEFREVCLLPDFSSHWLSWWSSYGAVLSMDKDKSFFAQKTGSEFDLLLGVYYYHKSVVIEKQLKESGSMLQLRYLELAMSYNSIHAYQKFHNYLYRKTENKEECLKLIIGNIKNLLPEYGSYAYLMLCEAYFRYGLYLNKKGDSNAAKAFDAAITACQNASQVYKEDDPIIYNASLGGSIASSNSMQLSEFDFIEELIQKSYHLSEDTIDVSPLITAQTSEMPTAFRF